MSLLLNQLVYTSFPEIGFKLLTSQQVPWQIQQNFMELVYRYWDSYNPPLSGFRAAYLYQPSADVCLFGWLYNNEMDDLGRSHVPYFVCYYLNQSLQPHQLRKILTCLHKGPLITVEQPSSSLDLIEVPDSCGYDPVRPGAFISSELQEHCYKNLKHKQLLNLFVPADETTMLSEGVFSNDSHLQTQMPGEDASRSDIAFLPVDDSDTSQLEQLPLLSREPIPTPVEAILQKLFSKPIGVQGAVLVSSEGQPLTAPVGMDENSALVLAGTMLYLAKNACEECDWSEIETICVRAKNGHVVLSSCTPDVFLLVKAAKMLTGLLDGEISRTVKKLQAQLKDVGHSQALLNINTVPQIPKLSLLKTAAGGGSGRFLSLAASKEAKKTLPVLN